MILISELAREIENLLTPKDHLVSAKQLSITANAVTAVERYDHWVVLCERERALPRINWAECVGWLLLTHWQLTSLSLSSAQSYFCGHRRVEPQIIICVKLWKLPSRHWPLVRATARSSQRGNMKYFLSKLLNYFIGRRTATHIYEWQAIRENLLSKA